MSIPVVELAFSAVLERDDHGLRFLGPTVRGALGTVLKDTVCQVAHRDCARCHLAGLCTYPLIFDGRAPEDRTILRRYPTIPQPFVLDVAGPGSWTGTPRELLFGIRLFGDAGDHWTTVIDTIEAMGRRGLGSGRTRFRVAGVQDASTGALVWHNGAPGQVPARAVHLHQGPPFTKSMVRIRFETPLSLRDGGQRALSPPSPLALILAARRRLQILTAFYGCVPDALASHTTLSVGRTTPAPDDRDAPPPPRRFDEEEFRVIDAQTSDWSIERFSGRQQRRVPLGGITGHMVIEGPWPEVGGWFRMLERTHLGKHTSFGLGRITVEELTDA